MLKNKVEFYMNKTEELTLENLKLQNQLQKIKDNTVRCYIHEAELKMFQEEDEFDIEINNPAFVDGDSLVDVCITRVSEPDKNQTEMDL